ncbi:hypothetical protein CHINAEXTREME_20875 (plasmid) [Halobiforma lacisalsi AJ5]|uniref:Uncharacterized protein n=1 Tax=Natronobacterium lacisalsi AJ5 TaxID=358396 RepID=M0LC50_NATLA|nr:hypothetical protein [Halobiforma lacisalsi]APX00259.1 hypothetical protein CHINAEXTREME_20875 [Halobiforma lacisalsi AJ5]EMA29994.1 hypothetical protein C445_16849 [Halobiforma lacisalsi AJ5]
MTDVTHAVTQSALEAFTREYLNNLGAAIREDGNRWQVRLPTHVDVDFSDRREFEITLDGEKRDQGEDSVCVLTPESEFTQQLLDEAAAMATVGQLALTDTMIDDDYRYPLWIVESDVEVVDAAFSPYYDRTAICVFVRIDVETVSEYQTQFLEAVTIDVESNDQLPGVTEILVDEFFSPKSDWRDDVTVGSDQSDVTIAPDKLANAITTGQKAAVEGVQEEIDEIRQSASHAADSEFEEYRQLQEQRINDHRSEIDALSNRLQNLSTDVDDADSQQQRVEALEKRRELKAEKEDLETELEELLQKKEQGYAQKQREIYRRHAIEVNTKPSAFTLVTYERGEIEFTVGNSDRTDTVRAPYAIGAGVTDEVHCESCNTQLSEENSISMVAGRLGCQSCW